MTTVLGGQLELASAAFAAAAVWLLVLDDRPRLTLQRRVAWRRRLPWVLAVLGPGVLFSLRGLVDLVLVVDLVVAGVVAAVVARLLARGRSRGSAAQRRTQVVAACDALVAELRSGQPPQVALEQVAQEWPELAPAASAAGMGGDIPTSLRGLAALPGAEPLMDVAAAWQVSTRSGASLADVLDRLGGALRDQEDTARETAAAVAPARATGHLLAVLPLLGLGLGTALGGDPLRVLLATPAGSVLLALGAALALAGVLWVERLVTTAEG